MPGGTKILRDALQRRWVHSHEEDRDDEMVFRPAEYALPPSRGRKSFELRADGSLVESAPGPADRPVHATGRWRLDNDESLSFFEEGSNTPTRVLRVRSLQADKLVVERRRR